MNGWSVVTQSNMSHLKKTTLANIDGILESNDRY